MTTIAIKIYGASRRHCGLQDPCADQEAAGRRLRPLPDLRGQDAVFVLDRSATQGAPSNHTINVREVRLAAGAEFVVMVCGDIMTMPGLPKVPSAVRIDMDDNGKVIGLF